MGKNQDLYSTYSALTVILVSSDAQNVCARYDTSAATQNLPLAAESPNIGSCWGYFVTQAFQTEAGQSMCAELKIPEGYHVYTYLRLGYTNGKVPR